MTEEPPSSPAISAPPSRWPQPWLFAIVPLACGVFTGFYQTPLPWLLRHMGYSVDRIGAIESLIMLPISLYFLATPVVDFALRRRTWSVVLSCMSASLLFCAIVLLHRHIDAAIWLLFLGCGLNQMTFACANGLMAQALQDADRNRAAAWAQGGTLAAQALGGGLPEPPPQSSLRNLRASCLLMLRETKETLFSLQSLPGILLLLSPVGTGAAQNLFPAIASEYHVGQHGVVLLNGVFGGVLTMLGAFVAVVVPAHLDRRIAYAASGLSASFIGIFLTFAPLTPTAYYAGAGLYLLTTGACWGFFLGVVMVTLGPAGAGTSTRATILVCIGNLPIVYMTRIEGWAYGSFGIRGIPASDAIGNLLVVLAVGIWLTTRLRKPAEPLPA
jgi:PAT family beta-lactamase induction signal transducer AmpG